MIAITPGQLKTANLIFVDHSYLQEKVNLLQQQISNDSIILNNTYTIDSLRNEQLSQYKVQINALNEQKDFLKKSLTCSNFVAGGSVITTVILAVVLWTTR